MRFGIVVILLAVVTQSAVGAGPLRRFRPTASVSAEPSQAAVQTRNATSIRPTEPQSTLNPKFTKSVDDALEEVNAERARRGLRPFLADPLLNQAARSCAKIRATNRIEGHLASDFVYLPAGASAAAAGCGALEPSWGWGTCCTYENYTYAGAAWVMGGDGQRYMHLFVR
jgi:hypothetical protein